MAHIFNDGCNVISPLVSVDSFVYHLLGARKAQVQRCALSGVDDSPETLDKGLWQFGVYEPHTCATGAIFTPVCPWPGSKYSIKPEALLSFH